ncbi:MAG: sulfide/dihydroorotate dehydrogenase-like FAD/NAD-binding protein [Elusimicrobiota bacterium]|nr:sulfide/dihydroorotate dehydrogenase-like FAD/NAD-binding protein [Elusimicrobiota bacterium]
MNKIISKKLLGPQINLIELEAEAIAKKILPGQFVILRVHSKGERIPLTVAKKDLIRGTITIIFQEVGKTTKLLSKLNIGEEIQDLIGPLGNPTEIISPTSLRDGNVVVIGGGVGIAEILPVAEALKNAGNKIIGIIGARTKELVILEDELRQITDELHITTDDGSYGKKGFVTDVLKQLLDYQPSTINYQLIYAVGPVPMMKKVAEVTKPYNIKTVVSLNPIMVDGTGMCGSCRVTVGGKTKFACVDGPEFDAHQVNWAELENRLKLFQEQEKISINIL